MDKRFWGVIAAIVVIFVGIVVVNNQNKDGNSVSAKASEHYYGQNEQDVTLVEYGDFQCPVCATYYPVVEAVKMKYEKDIRFQFRNFPIQSIHQNAVAASRAAEAAGKQGKFWEMYGLIYQNQDPSGQQGWVKSSDPLNQFFSGFAGQIGLNVDTFKKDFASEEVNAIVNADLAAGRDQKVTGTPTFFLDGKRLELEQLTGDDGRPSEEKLSQLIDKAIRDKGGTTSVNPSEPATTENTGQGEAAAPQPETAQ